MLLFLQPQLGDYMVWSCDTGQFPSNQIGRCLSGVPPFNAYLPVCHGEMPPSG